MRPDIPHDGRRNRPRVTVRGGTRIQEEIESKAPAVNVDTPGPEQQAYRDADGFGDAAVVRFLRASDLSQLGGEVPIDMEVFDNDWTTIRLPVPPQAIGETVLIEWNFISDDTPDTYSGLSIDDVRVGD